MAMGIKLLARLYSTNRTNEPSSSSTIMSSTTGINNAGLPTSIQAMERGTVGLIPVSIPTIRANKEAAVTGALLVVEQSRASNKPISHRASQAIPIGNTHHNKSQQKLQPHSGIECNSASMPTRSGKKNKGNRRVLGFADSRRLEQDVMTCISPRRRQSLPNNLSALGLGDDRASETDTVSPGTSRESLFTIAFSHLDIDDMLA